MNNGETDYPDLPEVKMVPAKERWANQIAQTLLQIFKWTLSGLLCGGLLVVAVSMYATGGNADVTVKVMKDAVVPFIKEVGTLIATIFGSLLAFVLGHYFGKDKG